MLSYSSGPDIPILETTIQACLEATAGRFPDREALVVPHDHVRLTWRELHNEVERTARGLAVLGLKPGDRLGIWSTNCARWVLLQLACARAGLVLVNVNPAYRRFVDSFPMTVTGKVQKYLIRQQEIHERGLEEVAQIETA